MAKDYKIEPGYVLIFRPWITTRNGRRIYPRRGKVFCLKVRADKVA